MTLFNFEFQFWSAINLDFYSFYGYSYGNNKIDAIERLYLYFGKREILRLIERTTLIEHHITPFRRKTAMRAGKTT